MKEMLKFNQTVSKEQKIKMMRILKEFEKQRMEDENEDDPSVLLEETENEDANQNSSLDDLDLNNLKLEDLTSEQLKDFQRAISDGRIGNVLEVWTPWWEVAKERENKTNKIQVIDDNESTDVFPTIEKEHIVPLHTLIKTQPSPLLQFNLLEILYSYIYTIRIFNGDLISDSLESFHTFMELSLVLSQNLVYQEPTSALHACIERSLQPSAFDSIEFSISVLNDMNYILSSIQYILMALADILHLIKSCLHQVNSFSLDQTNLKDLKKKLHSSQKKIEFYLSWTNEQDKGLFVDLSLVVKMEHSLQLETIQNKNKPKSSTTINETPTSKKKILVEEIK